METPWPADGDLPWDIPEPESTDDSWRGNEHFEDWPENLAGPEYWLYKNQEDE